MIQAHAYQQQLALLLLARDSMHVCASEVMAPKVKQSEDYSWKSIAVASHTPLVVDR